MRSEFGYGLVVPLVKFTEHLNDDRARLVEQAIRWKNMEPIEREQIIVEEESEWRLMLALEARHGSADSLLTDCIQMWAYSASDHLAGVETREAPKSLQDLVQHVWSMRLPDRNATFGEGEWRRIRTLWREATLDIDEKLGLEPDWGTW